MGRKLIIERSAKVLRNDMEEFGYIGSILMGVSNILDCVLYTMRQI